MVDINIRALKKVKEILENNLHDVATKSSQDDIEEVVEAAKALGIEMTNVKVSPATGKTKIKGNKTIDIITIFITEDFSKYSQYGASARKYYG